MVWQTSLSQKCAPIHLPAPAGWEREWKTLSCLSDTAAERAPVGLVSTIISLHFIIVWWKHPVSNFGDFHVLNKTAFPPCSDRVQQPHGFMQTFQNSLDNLKKCMVVEPETWQFILVPHKKNGHFTDMFSPKASASSKSLLTQLTQICWANRPSKLNLQKCEIHSINFALFKFCFSDVTQKGVSFR